MIGLIRKVTGVTISAFFKAKGTYKYSGQKMEMPWHSNSGFGHQIRKYRMRYHSYHEMPRTHFLYCLSGKFVVRQQLVKHAQCKLRKPLVQLGLLKCH